MTCIHEYCNRQHHEQRSCRLKFMTCSSSLEHDNKSHISLGQHCEKLLQSCCFHVKTRLQAKAPLQASKQAHPLLVKMC